MYLVQFKQTGNYNIVDTLDESIHVNYNDNVIVWTSEGVKLTNINTVKENLNRINSLKSWSEHRELTKTILAKWFCTEQENIDSILSESEQINIIANIYAKVDNLHTHEGAGRSYYNTFRATLIYKVNHNNITMDDAKFISQKLKDVIAELIRGDWISAIGVLSEITIEGVLTQDIINSLLADFTDYITNNY